MLNTTAIQYDFSDATYMVSVNDEIVEPCASEARAREVLAARLASGWRVWRDSECRFASERTESTPIRSILLTISDREIGR